MATPLYILDTNILIQFVRASALWVRIRDAYQLLTIEPRPIVSVMTEAELRSLAKQWKWGHQKLDQVEYILGYLRVVSNHDADIIRAYVTIDSHSESIGRPMGKNDLWIAATASVMGATLLTTDRDFDHLAPVYLSRDWIDDPDTAA